MYAVIRRYRVRLGTVRRVIRDAEKEFLPLLRQIPGFAACYLLEGGNGFLTSIGLFDTSEGSGTSVELHRTWFRDDWSSVLPVAPEVISGEVLAQASAERAVPEPMGVMRGSSAKARPANVVPRGAPAAPDMPTPSFVALESPPEIAPGTSW